MQEYRKEIFRKSFHLSSAWMLLLIYYAPSPLPSVILATLLSSILLIEYSRKRSTIFSNMFNRLFGLLMRKKELEHHKMGATHFLLAAVIVSALFSKVIAITSLAIMIFGDAFAAIIGMRFGKTKLVGSKTLVGATAFFITAIIVMLCANQLLYAGFGYQLILMTAGIATLAELYASKLHLDDNLLIPIISSFSLSL